MPRNGRQPAAGTLRSARRRTGRCCGAAYAISGKTRAGVDSEESTSAAVGFLTAIPGPRRLENGGLARVFDGAYRTVEFPTLGRLEVETAELAMARRGQRRGCSGERGPFGPDYRAWDRRSAVKTSGGTTVRRDDLARPTAGIDGVQTSRNGGNAGCWFGARRRMVVTFSSAARWATRAARSSSGTGRRRRSVRKSSKKPKARMSAAGVP